MTFWIVAIAVTAIVCAALYYASAGRAVNATAAAGGATTEHFRAHLKEIDADMAAGRLGSTEAQAAKGELARELLRHEGEKNAGPDMTRRPPVFLPLLLIACVAIGIYGFIGHPELPSEPLAARQADANKPLDLDLAVKQIEARLAQSPDDLRGWQVVAPVYMQMGRYADAVRAFRRIVDLTPPSAASKDDLAEALMMSNGGSVAGEPLELLKAAAAFDPRDIRSRYYIAAELNRTGDYAAAVPAWQELLALGQGGEPWMVTAKNSLALAQQGLDPAAAPVASAEPEPPPPDMAQIDAMVDGLESRIKSQGGTIAEWTQLIRSRMVQGRFDDAQALYDLARQVFPYPWVRVNLDVLAADNGLVAKARP